jgi:hypothetical protein
LSKLIEKDTGGIEVDSFIKIGVIGDFDGERPSSGRWGLSYLTTIHPIEQVNEIPTWYSGKMLTNRNVPSVPYFSFI